MNSKKFLFYDCFAGISGDMNLAALIDLGVDPVALQNELAKLGLSGWEMHVSEENRLGFRGKYVKVVDFSLLSECNTQGEYDHPVSGVCHDLDGSLHRHSHSHQEHPHRGFKEIKALIEQSALSALVKQRSLAIFQLIAEAEAKIHSTTIDDVHFHEVGALDSIIDIVGAAIAWEMLGVEKIMCSTVELGGGSVVCAHGKISVPAPATAAILQGKPVHLGLVPYEQTTPTGAAILVAFAEFCDAPPPLKIQKIGYGLGSRRLEEIPNLLKVYLMESSTQGNSDKNAEQNSSLQSSQDDIPQEKILCLSANLDDMNPEIYGPFFDKAFALGALDAWIVPAIMKKSRPAAVLFVLCFPDSAPLLRDLFFEETTTLGLREESMTRRVLSRDSSPLDTPWGQVRIKRAYKSGKCVQIKPEIEDIAALSQKSGESLKKIYRYILKEIYGSL